MIVVTGGSGKAGRACIQDLLAHHYEVASVDLVRPPNADVPFSRVDLTDFGQAVEALSGVDERVRNVTAVVHLAAIPAPGLATNAVTFATNTISTYNVFEAARQLGIKNVVWASSETVLGLPFDTAPPLCRLTKSTPAGQNRLIRFRNWSAKKMAKQFCRWDPQLKIIGLRFSNIM
jgi:nucleoside-diphosphate-sugar epimerase